MAAPNISNTVIVTTTVTPYGSNYLFSADCTGFSKFFLVDNLVALPVDLLSFSGYLNANGFSDLIWKITNQINLKNFEVQRSYNGREFTTIGSVQAIKNPATIQDYIYTDQLKAKAINFYRLKMVDTDDRFKYSGIIRINNNKPDKFVELLQNPVRNGISFIIDNASKQDVMVTVFNSGGQQVRTWKLGKQQGTILLPVDNKGMAAGVYAMRVRAGNRVESFRIVKQ